MLLTQTLDTKSMGSWRRIRPVKSHKWWERLGWIGHASLQRLIDRHKVRFQGGMILWLGRVAYDLI